MVSAEVSKSPVRISSSFCVSQRTLRLVVCLLLVLATIALYNPLSRAPFLNYDDDGYVVGNFHVRSGLSWSTVEWAFRTSAQSNWHPITWLAHALDVQLFAMNPAGHHYVNVLLHAANVVLLFLILLRGTGMLWRSAMVAALFAIHPINVESVAWISERKNVLSTLAFLLALAAYGWYVRAPNWRRYSLVAFCFALGLMTKPQVITLPCLLLLLDYWPLGRVPSREGFPPPQPQSPSHRAHSFAWLVLEKVPLFMLSAASALITMKVQVAATNLRFPLSLRVENAVLAYMKYLGKAVWPVDLAPLYPHPGFSISRAHAFMSLLALAAITAVAVMARKRRYVLVGWFWFLGALVPMIGLVQVGVQEMADRYAYIPLLGLFVIACWGAADLRELCRLPRFILAMVGSAALLALGFSCHRQIGYWGDNRSLWAHTLAVTRNNFIAEDGIANALMAQGQAEQALLHFQTAVRINPEDPVGNLNLGTYAQQHGNYDEAMARYQGVLRFTRNPRVLALAFTNLGYVQYTVQQYAPARQSFEAALTQVSENPQAFLGLGLLAQKSGDLAQAAGDYAKAVQMQPTDLGYLLLAQALEAKGESNAARAARAAATRMSPDLDAATLSMRRLLSD